MRKSSDKRRKPWPQNCPWPEPYWNGVGPEWNADEVDPTTLDEEAQELMDIKDYFDEQVALGRLNEDYSLNEDYAEQDVGNTATLDDPDPWEPDIGNDYWDDGFDLLSWEMALTEHMNLLKIDMMSFESDPAIAVREITGYDFINENLLRQAFTRRAFAIEYGLSGDSEELEFLGDMVLSTVVTREIQKHLSEVNPIYTDAPFRSKYQEGGFSRLRTAFVSKDHLASRASVLGLDRLILYGSAEPQSESALEDAVEALIGAVALDCRWDWSILSSVADKLICIQLNKPDQILKQSYYDLFNAWHQKHFGHAPSYTVDGSEALKNREPFHCTIRFTVPENDRGIHTAQRIDVDAETRSKAREYAAESAYRFVINKGLWINLADAGLTPDLERSINQLQELFQKKYVEQAPAYEFSETVMGQWECTCTCGGISGFGMSSSKTKAKKKAAFMILVKLLDAAGICEDEWRQAMWRTLDP